MITPSLESLSMFSRCIAERGVSLAIKTSFLDSFIVTPAARATTYSDPSNMASAISSGTHKSDGMIIAPCSMKTLAAISFGYDDTLVARAAGVTIKESRKLVLMARETPLSAIHLENMLKLSRLGVIILPPVTEFYTKPKTISDIVDHGVGKCLDQFNIPHTLYERWGSN